MNVETAQNFINGTDMGLLNYCFQLSQTLTRIENYINIGNNPIMEPGGMNVETAQNFINGTDMGLLNYCFQLSQTLTRIENYINIGNNPIMKEWSA